LIETSTCCRRRSAFALGHQAYSDIVRCTPTDVQ
jgi:hypothetical protein